MITALLGDELLAVEEIILDFTVSRAGAMQELVSFMVQNRGKRLRPILVLLCGGTMQENRDELYRIAAAVELIHTASLLHDDVIDGALSRRGKPSLNALYGNSPAVLTGDYFFARAFELISLCEDNRLTRLFTAAISTMCEGEIEQMRNAFNWRLDEVGYLRCAYSKTAALLEACCEAGALLASEGVDRVQKYKEFGRNLGMAFQITDDLLDISGDPATTGKPAGSDLREGTITLPLIYILEDPRWGTHLRELIEKRDFSPESLAFLAGTACQDGPLARARQQAATYLAMAVENLHHLQDTPEINVLKNLANQVLQRTN